MSTEEYRDFVADAMTYLEAAIEQCKSQFNLGSYEKYAWDQEQGTMVFSADGVPKVIAHIQFVGAYSAASHTWSWCWAMPGLKEGVKGAMTRVKEFGDRHGLPQLSTPEWDATEEDGWAMTAVSAKLLDAKGAYKAPGDDDSVTFIVFTDIAWASNASGNEVE